MKHEQGNDIYLVVSIGNLNVGTVVILLNI